MNKSKKTSSKKSNRRRFDDGDGESKNYGRGKKTAAHNDISWYVADGQILNDAARIPYSHPTGTVYTREPKINYGSPNTTVVANRFSTAVSGIYTQWVMPMYGYAKNQDDPLNVAANGIYTFVRHLNSGSRNYDPADLMIYVGAADSLYSMIAWGTRIFATISTYHQANRYIPRQLLIDQGIDADDFISNLAKFRAGMNVLIPKVSTLMVPNVMPIFQRHAWLFSNYYIEGDTLKDQIYQYAPLGFYHFELDNDGAGMLKAFDVHRGENLITVNGFLNTLQYMLDPIIQDEDFNIMSGDIYKAYAGNVVTLQLLPDQLLASFNYDENVLLQFKNATCHPIPVDSQSADYQFTDGAFNINQDATKTYLKVTLGLTNMFGHHSVGLSYGSVHPTQPSSQLDLALANITAETYSRPKMITINKSDVSAEDNMIITRGTMILDLQAAAGGYVVPIDVAVGSEWYAHFTVSCTYRNNNTNQYSVRTWEWSSTMDSVYNQDWTIANTIERANTAIRGLNLLSQFKYHAEVDVFTCGWKASSQDNLTVDVQSIDMNSNFELDNYALIDFEVAKGLHNAALLGEFNIPRVALSPTFK